MNEEKRKILKLEEENLKLKEREKEREKKERDLNKQIEEASLPVQQLGNKERKKEIKKERLMQTKGRE